MRKKLIAFALATASVATFADVNLYGRVAVGLENDSFPNSTVPGSGSVQDFGSYFGIRGNDQVYGETSAIWQIEQYIDVTSGQAYYNTTGGGLTVPNPNGSSTGNGHVNSEVNTLASGESYLGLQGAWGRLRLGNISNYFRQAMGGVDTFNYANGVDGLGTYSRTSKLLSTSIGYTSPSWGGFNFAGMYSFQTNGGFNVSGVNGGNNLGGDINGVYSGGILSGGVAFKKNDFSVKLGTMITQQVGTYSTSNQGMANSSASPNPYANAAYENAYADRLEFSYEDPEGMIIGVGLQITDGQGWNSWANSGGSFNNYITNPGFNVAGLNSNQYQTQETAFNFGWHIGPWTPKVAYVYGNNMMYGGSILSVATGSANQIANSGYQVAVAELDWNITPKTIVFINYGQTWWGNTMQNVSYCGANCGASGGTVNSGNAYQVNQASTAIGFTHTF